MRVRSAFSRHPEPAVAAAEVVGAIAEALGTRPALVVLVVGADSAGSFRDIVDTVETVLDPVVLLGTTAGGVIGGTEEAIDGPAVALWAVSRPRWAVTAGEEPTGMPAFRTLRVEPVPGGAAVVDPPLSSLADSTVFVLGDSGTFDSGTFDSGPSVAADGGCVGGSLAEASAQILMVRRDAGAQARFYDDGVVGIVFAPGTTRRVGSTGARPIGSAWTITACRGRLVETLGGRPALERLNELIAGLDARDRFLASRGLFAGLAAVEPSDGPSVGDFSIRPVVGGDRHRGALAIAGRAEVGATLQFFVLDAPTAHDDLTERLEAAVEDRGLFAGALIAMNKARASDLFAEPGHEAHLIAETAIVPGGGLAGWFTVAELVPLDSDPRQVVVQGCSTTVLLIGPAGP